MKHGHEKGGIKGSRKGIKYGFAGRHLSETEHMDRMKYESNKVQPTEGINKVQEELNN